MHISGKAFDGFLPIHERVRRYRKNAYSTAYDCRTRGPSQICLPSRRGRDDRCGESGGIRAHWLPDETIEQLLPLELGRRLGPTYIRRAMVAAVLCHVRAF